MKIRTEKLIIELEENEIDDFWNIIEGTLDFCIYICQKMIDALLKIA